MKNVLKIVALNTLVFLVLLLAIETAAYLGRLATGKKSVGWVFHRDMTAKEEIENDCRRMRTHPFYSHTHDHKNGCKIKGGYADGQFVYYGNRETKYSLLTLGGSTTDGFFQHVSEGSTWPYLLSKIFDERNIDIAVINGGVGAYGSSQELLKLLIDGGSLDTKIKYVISLNGINDTSGYQSLSPTEESSLPFWTVVLLDSFRHQMWLDQSRENQSVLPSTMSLVRFLANKTSSQDLTSWEQALYSSNVRKRRAVDHWFYNVRMMRAISNELGAKYYVFLQPTMGLSGTQVPSDVKSNDYLLYSKLSKEYVAQINEHYEYLRSYCSKLSYCFDISGIAPPDGDSYHDPRHHNAKGNAIIAEHIFKILQKQNSWSDFSS